MNDSPELLAETSIRADGSKTSVSTIILCVLVVTSLYGELNGTGRVVQEAVVPHTPQEVKTFIDHVLADSRNLQSYHFELYIGYAELTKTAFTKGGDFGLVGDYAAPDTLHVKSTSIMESYEYLSKGHLTYSLDDDGEWKAQTPSQQMQSNYNTRNVLVRFLGAISACAYADKEQIHAQGTGESLTALHFMCTSSIGKLFYSGFESYIPHADEETTVSLYVDPSGRYVYAVVVNMLNWVGMPFSDPNKKPNEHIAGGMETKNTAQSPPVTILMISKHDNNHIGINIP